MSVSSPAIEWVRIVAERLGDLREEVAFLGGATIGLLITDPAAAAVCPTKDVDVYQRDLHPSGHRPVLRGDQAGGVPRQGAG